MFKYGMETISLLVVAVVLTLQSAAYGQQKVESDDPMIGFCSHFDAGQNAEYDLACLQYVTGFVNGYVFGGGTDICPPDGVDMKQTTLVVAKYLRDHPQKLHEGLGANTWVALSRAFPCEKKKPR